MFYIFAVIFLQCEYTKIEHMPLKLHFKCISKYFLCFSGWYSVEKMFLQTFVVLNKSRRELVRGMMDKDLNTRHYRHQFEERQYSSSLRSQRLKSGFSVSFLL